MKEKMRINLFQIQKVLPDLDLMRLEDDKLLALISNWSAFLFDHEFRCSQSEDPIKYCKEEFHKVGYVNANNLHCQFRRDHLVRAEYALELLKICGFTYKDVGNDKKRIELTTEKMKKVTEFIKERIDNFNMLFEVSRNEDDYEFTENSGKIRFIKNMTKFLKHIGLKLRPHDVRTRKSRKKSKNKKSEKEQKKYSLQRLFDLKLNINP